MGIVPSKYSESAVDVLDSQGMGLEELFLHHGVTCRGGVF